MVLIYILTLYSALLFQFHIFVLEKRDNEDKIDRFNRENKSFESPQDGYLNYYDTVRIILTNYERVSANQAIPTNVVYLLF